MCEPKPTERRRIISANGSRTPAQPLTNQPGKPEDPLPGPHYALSQAPSLAAGAAGGGGAAPPRPAGAKRLASHRRRGQLCSREGRPPGWCSRTPPPDPSRLCRLLPPTVSASHWQASGRAAAAAAAHRGTPGRDGTVTSESKSAEPCRLAAPASRDSDSDGAPPRRPGRRPALAARRLVTCGRSEPPSPPP